MTDQTIPADKLQEVIDQMVANLETDAGDDEDRGFHRATALWRDALDGLLPTPPVPLAEIRFGGKAMWGDKEVLIVADSPNNSGRLPIFWREECKITGSDQGWVNPSELLQHPDDAESEETSAPEPYLFGGHGPTEGEQDPEGVEALVDRLSAPESQVPGLRFAEHDVYGLIALAPNDDDDETVLGFIPGDLTGWGAHTAIIDWAQHEMVEVKMVPETPRKTLVTEEDYRAAGESTVVRELPHSDMTAKEKYEYNTWYDTLGELFTDADMAGVEREVLWEPEV